jgi:hypothetical protein
MNKRKSLIVLLVGIVMIAILSFCYSKSHYSGDGKLIDNGSLAATDRYVLDLGVVELNKKGIYTFKLKNLPTVNFVIGIKIQVSPKHQSVLETKNVKPIISLELLNPQNVQVIHNQSSLDTWTWSVKGMGNTAFVYRREFPSTYFTPAPDGLYNLRIVIVRPDSSDMKYTARLQAKSGGWK